MLRFASLSVAVVALAAIMGSTTIGIAAKPSQCGTAEAGAVPSLKARVQPIFDDNCVACHQQASAEHDLVLEQGLAHKGIVGRPAIEAKLALVTPGDPHGSYLYRKVEGTHGAVGGSGEQMPLGGALAAADIVALCQWIEGGAPDN